MEDMPSTEDMIAEVTGGAEFAPESMPEQQIEATPVQEFEYSANGKTIKEPLDMILKRASQGYNYAQHMQDLKSRQQEVEQQHQKAVELEKKYGEIDRFAQENPEWNDHLHKTWESRFNISGAEVPQGAGNAQSTAGIPEQFLNEFNQMKAVIDNIQAEKADQAYQQSVNRVREQYPDIDFNQTDADTGRSLEQQVLDYAQENGINRFEPAFKAFYSDKLIERARLQAKEQMAGNLKQRAKAGLLGTSSSPSSNNADGDYPANYKNMSMDQIHNWIVDKYAN